MFLGRVVTFFLVKFSCKLNATDVFRYKTGAACGWMWGRGADSHLKYDYVFRAYGFSKE